MKVNDATLVLDRAQLREVTLEDEDLMRQLLEALIEDTSQQIGLLEAAVRSRDVSLCLRLAHYSKGACASVGANSAASVLENIEQTAARGALEECGSQIAMLADEVERLRAEEL